MAPDVPQRLFTLTSFATREDARRALEALDVQGFSGDQVGILASEEDLARLATLSGDRAGEGAVAGGLVGALVGGVVAMAVAPELFVGGALAATLSGVVAGGSAGSVLGMLGGMGVPEPRAEALAERLEAGDIVVSVATDDPIRASVARHAMAQQAHEAPVRIYQGQ